VATIPNSSTKQPLSIETLSARHTTKTAIIDHRLATFSICLSDRMMKPQLIVAYQQLAANPKLTSPQPNPPQPGQQSNRPQQHPAPHPFMSEWTIHRKPGTEATDFRRPFNGDPLALVRHIQTTLQQHLAEAEPPLTLVAGRWSIGLTSNFILTFAGKPSTELIKNTKVPYSASSRAACLTSFVMTVSASSSSTESLASANQMADSRMPTNSSQSSNATTPTFGNGTSPSTQLGRGVPLWTP
jgi:hypothetical protein